MRVVLTRPEGDSEALRSTLERRGHQTLLAPMLEIRPAVEAEMAVSRHTSLIITSRNAIRSVSGWRRFLELTSCPVWCVGPKTRSDCLTAGFRHIEYVAPTATALTDAIVASRPSDRDFVYLSGADVAADVVGRLAGAGLSVRRVVVYEAEAAKALPADVASALSSGGVDAVAFYSKRTAETFAKLIAEQGLHANLKTVNALCLSSQVRCGLGDLGAAFRQIRVAEAPNGQEMLALIDLVAAQLSP